MGEPRKAAELRASFEEDVANSASHRYYLWPVEEKATGEIVGHCGLLDKEINGKTEIELIYVFAKKTWGKGYATEIACALRDRTFEHMGLQRLVSPIDPGNVASGNVAVKVGMHLEQEIVRPGGVVKRLYAVPVGQADAPNRASA
jgi:RimJ/RimL family protein N-acetyltransferase